MRLKMRVSALVLALVLALVSTGLVAAQGTVVAVQPPTQQVFLGGTTTVEIWANGVVDFYGAQFTLTYDPLIVEGVSIEPGSAFTAYPDEYEVAVATIGAGTANFAATLLRVPKAGPLAGDLQLAVITFNAAAVGTSPVALSAVKLSNVAGEPIAFTTADGVIEVVDRPTLLNGYAFMEGRSDHSGIVVSIDGTTLSTTTDAAGFYEFTDVPAGVYTVTMSANLYLSAAAVDVNVLEHETNVACEVTLLGGDLNADGVIDILDLSLCAANFDTPAAEADVNADGMVDVYDLVLLGKNFKLTAPTVYDCTP